MKAKLILGITAGFVLIFGTTPAQNYGIGTETPNSKLHVVQEDANNALRIDDELNDTSPFVIDSAGNVGIGKETPTEALDVNGKVKATIIQSTGKIEAADTLKTNARVKDKTGLIMPVGTVLSYAGTTLPDGWLWCDGSLLAKPLSPADILYDLYQSIGTAWGGDGVTNFRLPDMRGMFMRGIDNGAGNDPDATTRTAMYSGGNIGDNVGSYQCDTLKSHNHTAAVYLFDTPDIPSAKFESSDGGSNDVAATYFTGGNETRPKNVYVNFIIKY